MGIELNARARGLVGARADANNPTAILNELKTTFETFKAEREKEVSDLKKGLADVVQTEKVDRINAEITKLQTALDEVNVSIAALKVGGIGDGQPQSAEKKEHAKAFNQFFRKGAENGLRDLEVKASLRTDSDPDGGYVVPDQMETTIDRVLGTVSAMRSISRVMSISAGTYKKLVNQGGAAGGWVGEKDARPETATPKLSALEFPAMELYANPAATQTLLDDARVSIEQWLADEVSITFAEMEGAAFVAGSGVNQPRGLLSYDTVANANYAWGKIGYVATGVSGDWPVSTPSDKLVDLIYTLKAGYRANARFVMNRRTQAAIRKLKDDDNNYLWQPAAVAGGEATLMGFPVTEAEDMPDIAANALALAFGDFRRGYLVVDRLGVSVLRDPYSAKPYVLFYTVKRVGGGVQDFDAIKLLKFGTS